MTEPEAHGPRLRRVLGPLEVTASGVGIIIGAGIYVLLGAATEEAGNAVAVLEAAVLFEAGWEDLVDEIWCVVVEPDLAVKRLATRNNLDEDAARARINSQLTNAERTAKSNVVIENNSSLEDLTAAIAQEWDKLQTRLQTAAGRE